MNIRLIKLSREELLDDREQLRRETGMSYADLRQRVVHEVATASERTAYERLMEIAFLLGEDV